MAYFLKKTRNKKGVYLQIYDSFYDPERKQTAHASLKPLGYLHELVASGIEDPIAYFQQEVIKLNQERNEQKQLNKVKQITDQSPKKQLGYFPLKNINDSLHLKEDLDTLQSSSKFKFNIFEMLSDLIYARAVSPCSKRKTFEDLLPKLFEPCNFSLAQLYTGLEFMGNEYKKIIEIYNHHISQKFSFDTNFTYFDCTNFYFEIDQEDSLRRKGPSKENRKEPIVGLGLLLDANQIPLGMQIYPGNESEKPVLRNVIDDLRRRSNITGKTIRVADKGLNCGENIFHAHAEGDGYIFSKSVKQLPKLEKEWVLLEQDYQIVKDAAGQELYRFKECIDEFPYEFTDSNGQKRKIRLEEKRVVTYNPSLATKRKHEINKQVEKAKKLQASAAKRIEYGDCAKYMHFEVADKKGVPGDGKIKVSLNEASIEEDRRLAGFNMIVTSETHLSAEYIYSAYHNLWRIEESFKVMKSQLDMRPVYLQKEETITGHFLICYLAVLLLRLLQFKVLGNQYSTETIMDFIKNFQVTKLSERVTANMTRRTTFIEELEKKTCLPLTLFYIKAKDIKNILDYRF